MTEKIFYPTKEDYQELEDEIIGIKLPDWVAPLKPELDLLAPILFANNLSMGFLNQGGY